MRLRRGGGRPEPATKGGHRENQPRDKSIYVWDKAVWFAPHGHHVAEPPDEWTRRRLGDYENDYEKPEAQDSTKKCFMIAKKIRVNFEIDPLSGDRRGCMSCDPTVPHEKKCPQLKLRQDGLPGVLPKEHTRAAAPAGRTRSRELGTTRSSRSRSR